MRHLLLPLVLLLCVAAGPRVAVVTDSRGFVHEVVKPTDGESLVVATLREVVSDAGGEFTHVPDAADLSPGEHDVVVFYTTGDIPLDAAALAGWVEAGGGVVGLHCATDTLKEDKAWVNLIGAAFEAHPWNADDMVTLDRLTDHPVAAAYADGAVFGEEIYVFRDPPTGVDVHLALDAGATEKKVDRPAPPVAWTKQVGDGRVAYSSLGHNPAVWASAEYRQHLAALIGFAAGEDAVTRGRDPWVFRCTLDGRARVIVVALGRGLWAAYDAQTCGLYKVWTGDIDLTGSVYDSRHGPQPRSVGTVHAQLGSSDLWRFLPDGDPGDVPPVLEPVGVRFAGYRVDGDEAVTFRYELTLPDGRVVSVTETPRIVEAPADAPDGVDPTRALLREITIDGLSDEAGGGASPMLRLQLNAGRMPTAVSGPTMAHPVGAGEAVHLQATTDGTFRVLMFIPNDEAQP